LAAHFCGDVLTYSALLAESKRSQSLLSKTAAIGLHGLVHGCFVWFWLWVFNLEGKLPAAVFIATTHFLIDWGRTLLEEKWFDENEFKILKRKDVFRWLMKKGGDAEVHSFMHKHLREWVVINITDQALHLTVIALFVVYVVRS
jgi:hypothetical protein